ncbi:MAG: hypothetical protein ACLFUS_17810, partial [Candidatus Sumerlaeia bacterium]
SRDHPPLDDYSEPMLKHFRSWLREKYGNDPAALQKSWAMANVDFDKAIIPPEKRRLRIDMEPLRFGEKDFQVYDYETCLHEAREAFIIAWCRAIKEAASKPVLTCLSRAACSDMMLISEWVDVHHGPYIYFDRKLLHINGYAKASYEARGKLHVCQIDTGTHLMPKTGGDPLGITGVWPGPHRLNDNMWESLEMLERDVAYSVARNSYLYWNEGGPGWMFPVVCHGTMTWGRFWFDAPEIKEHIVAMKQMVDHVEESGAKSTARVALVSSDYLDIHLPKKSSVGRLFNRHAVQRTLARAGVQVDDYVLEDFEGIEKTYDVYIFPNAFYVPSDLREYIRKKLAADKATALWLYAPGYMDEKGAGLENIQALTGIQLGGSHNTAPVQIASLKTDHPFFAGLAGTASFGSGSVPKPNNSYEPLPEKGYVNKTESVDLPASFYCDDPQAEMLASLENKTACGMAQKEKDGFRSIWIAAPFAPWQIWRNICQEAGVHVYSETGDQVMANDRFVALYCLSGGEKIIHLPKACKVTDAIDNRLIDEKTSQIHFRAKAGMTKCFSLEEYFKSDSSDVH